MKTRLRCFVALLALSCQALQASESTVLFSTGFEPGEGYDDAFTLSGQQGWVTDLPPECTGNGLLNEPPNQQAYIGFFPLCSGETALSLWQPLEFSPLAAGKPIIKFSVRMTIVDSGNGQYDCFRWSVYGSNSHRLFSVDFDNSDLSINYLLESGANFVFTGRRFANDVAMDLEIEMDFSRNRWRADLDGTPLVTNQPITESGVPPHLSDIDAVWLYRNPTAPGDNFMLFDDYLVLAGELPRVNAVGVVGGRFLLRVDGERGRNYAIEASPDLKQWTAIRTNNAGDGSFDFLDNASLGQPQRFYRARLVR